MNAVSLLMAIHCHQPVGNFGFVFDEAYRRAYEPFLGCLERHPAVHLALHYSGSLLDWLEEHQPRFLDRLQRLAKRQQVELLASGYYEPILPLIPEEDRRGQIQLMQRTLQRRLGATASGVWLTERVWEPQLPQTLARQGIRYTILDTNQFQSARGVLPHDLQLQDDEGWDLLGCYATEYAGSTLIVFPASKRLRYWLPFQDVSRTIEFLKRLQPRAPIAITFADDGEKFGFWPKTHQWVYEQGWLEQFFTALERESSWLKTTTFEQYLAQQGPSGKAYLPCGSYEEMLGWSGGYFRNFFVKYPEANAMHHKMLFVSERLRGSRQPAAGSRQSEQRSVKTGKHPKRATQHSKLIARAQRELYMAQCNCAYWHGVFGGLYLAHLRRAVYSHLLQAESLLDQAAGRLIEREFRDVDGDGRAEGILRNRSVGIVVDPAEGGTVTELDAYAKSVNLVDTLTRRYEPYHEKLKAKRLALAAGGEQPPSSIHDLLGVKEEGLEARVVYDDHRRSCFIDSALSRMPTLQDISGSTWGEYRVWPSGPWGVESDRRPHASGGTTMTLGRRVQGGRLQKAITLMRREPRIVFQYQMEDVAVPVVGLEFNLCLRDELWSQPRWQEAVRECQVQDRFLGLAVTVTLDSPASLASFPIETISESEEGLERTYQGLAMVWLWPTDQAPRWSCKVEWRIEDL